MPARERQTGRVPGFIHFTAEDYRDAAQACRVKAVQSEKDAAAQSNPDTVKRFMDEAAHFRELAQRFENAARVR